ncbi:hypothetical protein Tsp_15318, partial [Trichinella spiralis]|uniref:hypothetical protein n=1 Tax=Trichinella spiralis TaxID=6334 RepID=UPI0001EFE659
THGIPQPIAAVCGDKRNPGLGSHPATANKTQSMRGKKAVSFNSPPEQDREELAGSKRAKALAGLRSAAGPGYAASNGDILEFKAIWGQFDDAVHRSRGGSLNSVWSTRGQIFTAVSYWSLNSLFHWTLILRLIIFPYLIAH